MLLWEALTAPRDGNGKDPHPHVDAPLVPRRLPYDKRCATVTKSGKRCRGRIRSGGEFCPLHDPAVAERRRATGAARRHPARRRLMNLPDGYLRKLTNRAAVGNAMDRLYRELRLELVSVQMGHVLFNILTRLLDSGLIDAGKVASANHGRSKAERLRPKLADLLTQRERRAWRRAVAKAPSSVFRAHEASRPVPQASNPKLSDPKLPAPIDHPVVLQAAS